MFVTIVLFAIFCFAANMADVVTTYIGVYVKKVAVEGDTAAGWMTSTPLRLWTIKPIGIALVCAIYILGVGELQRTTAGNAIAALGVVTLASAGIYGLISAIRNFRINSRG